MKWIAYAAFARNALVARLAYRNQVWSGALGDLVFTFARIAIWISVYSGSVSHKGVTLDEMITYSVIAGPLLYWDYARLLSEVDILVRSGSIATYLVKPLHFPGFLLATTFGNFVFETATMTVPIAVVIWFTFGLMPPPSAFYGLASLAYWFLSFMMLFTLALLLGLAAFWLMTAQSLDWLFNGVMTLLSGGLVPLWFFPTHLAVIAGHLPFSWISYYPAAVYLGKLEPSEVVIYLAVGSGWLAILVGLSALVWSAAQRRLIVQGG